MAQIFHRSFNVLSKVSIFGSVFFIVFAGWAWAIFVRSDYRTGAGVVHDQPVPFSHQHHVGGLGIDCRYCHGKDAGPNPWGATGLEWQTASPPPTENFAVTPEVTREPYDYAPEVPHGV